IQGWRCDDCALARAERSPRCPECGGHLGEAEFGPEGTVWSSTIVHLDIGGITAPYGLAYVDLDDGPRFLAHTTDALSPIPVGAPVKIVGTTPAGDVQVAPIDREAAS
ncbi:Zn-ribbon domain-containing OB-fold protein, partial [Ilumatobacter sp.]|uniref:Zn-ribbon domain-containing OB-fold protein n=1 Tax=Ilumatobacter sp. TaxID=1967498 RepID=UPI003751929B